MMDKDDKIELVMIVIMVEAAFHFAIGIFNMIVKAVEMML